MSIFIKYPTSGCCNKKSTKSSRFIRELFSADDWVYFGSSGAVVNKSRHPFIRKPPQSRSAPRTFSVRFEGNLRRGFRFHTVENYAKHSVAFQTSLVVRQTGSFCVVSSKNASRASAASSILDFAHVASL